MTQRRPPPALPPELQRIVEALAQAREERDYRAAQAQPASEPAAPQRAA